MNAMPLKDDMGTIHAYICGNCNNLYHYGNKLNNNLDFAMSNAEKCCICRDCGKQVNDHFMNTMCTECWDIQCKEMEIESNKIGEEYEKEYQKSKDVHCAKRLAERMSDISEDHYCAGWLNDLEFTLWSMLQGGDRSFGFSDVSECDLNELKELYDRAGGWWAWEKDKRCKTFMVTEEWVKYYENNKPPEQEPQEPTAFSSDF